MVAGQADELMVLVVPKFEIPTFALYHSRQTRKRFKFYKEDGKAFAMSATDVVRVKLWQSSGAVSLDLDSVAGTTLGSIVSIVTRGVDEQTPAEVIARFTAADVAALPVGRYKLEVGWVDDSQTSPDDPLEVAGRGLVDVDVSPGGDVGLA